MSNVYCKLRDAEDVCKVGNDEEIDLTDFLHRAFESLYGTHFAMRNYYLWLILGTI